MVPIVDLDSALHQLGLADRPVSVLKIDVEGYEPAVIAGAMKTLERTGAVILEYSPDLSSAGGLSGHDMLDRLFNAGSSRLRSTNEDAPCRVSAGELRLSTARWTWS